MGAATSTSRWTSGTRSTRATRPRRLAPSVTSQPSSQSVSPGSTVVFRAAAIGLPAPTFRWSFNGAALSDGPGVAGSAGPELVIGGASASSAGTYTCTVTNASGSSPSAPAILSVVSTADPGRLINISCRSDVGIAANILIGGFTIGGAGTSGAQSVLIRGSGPALGVFGVVGTLADPAAGPALRQTLVTTNDGWGGSAAVEVAANAVGAFPWTTPSSHDAALVETLGAGSYTAQVFGENTDSGIALMEVYDETPAAAYTPASPRLINLSARAQVRHGERRPYSRDS